MVVVEKKAERDYVTFHRKLPWGVGGWAEKNTLHHQGGDRKKNEDPIAPPQAIIYEQSLSSLLDDIMNKEIFIRTVSLIL